MNLSGTTLLSFQVSEGIVTAADGRTSDAKEHPKWPRVRNRHTKSASISNHYVAQKAGMHLQSSALLDRLENWGYKSKPADLETIVNEAERCAHILASMTMNDKDVDPKNVNFGVLISGFNKSKDSFEIGSVMVVAGEVKVKNELMRKIMGSGEKHATKFLDKKGDLKSLSLKEGVICAQEAILFASLFDKLADGDAHVFMINKHGCFEQEVKGSLEAYTEKINCLEDFESDSVLFLAYALKDDTYVRKKDNVLGEGQLIDLFKRECDVQAKVAHLVDIRESSKSKEGRFQHKFYFHRLLFKSEEDLNKVLQVATKNPEVGPIEQLAKQFSHTYGLNSTLKDEWKISNLFLNKASDTLLKQILSRSTQAVVLHHVDSNSEKYKRLMKALSERDVDVQIRN